MLKIEKTTIWDENTTYQTDLFNINSKDFHGSTTDNSLYNLLIRYTEVGDTVLDSMAGNGTLYFLCKNLNRKCIAFDLTPKHKEIKEWDTCKNIPLENNSVDFAYLHPPYFNIIKYSDKEEDLSNCKNIEDFLTKIRINIKENYRVLKNGKKFAITISDIFLKGKLIRLSKFLEDISTQQGFEISELIIRKLTNTKNMGLRFYRSKGRYLINNHEFILIFEKNQ